MKIAPVLMILTSLELFVLSAQKLQKTLLSPSKSSGETKEETEPDNDSLGGKIRKSVVSSLRDSERQMLHVMVVLRVVLKYSCACTEAPFSSFETKEPEKEDEEELEEDWMFNNMTSKAPSRKVSHESGADSMMDEVEMLQAKVQNIPTELSEAPSMPSEPVKAENEKKDQLKRKSTPAKGTYNPSNLGVLDQLASSSCSKAHFDSKSHSNHEDALHTSGHHYTFYSFDFFAT